MGHSRRKSIWDISETETTVSGWGSESAPESVHPAAVPVVEQLRVAQRKQRDRSWEKQSRNRPTSYRGVPPGLQTGIRQVAADLQVTIDDVGRAFLEYGLQCHRKGEICILPTLSRQRLTLFPEADDWIGVRRPGWFERVWEATAPPSTNQKKVGGKGAEAQVKPWRWPKVNYRRLPPELVATIRQLHEQHAIPTGEIVTLFLGHSLEAYRTGRLVLIPQSGSEPNPSYPRQR